MSKGRVGSLHSGCLDRRSRRRRDVATVWLVPALECRDRIVDSGRDVRHIDQAFILKGIRSDHRVLRELVPLLHHVAGRQLGPRAERKGADDGDCRYPSRKPGYRVEPCRSACHGDTSSLERRPESGCRRSAASTAEPGREYG